MSFLGNIGTNRMNRVIILQQEKLRNLEIRKSGHSSVASKQTTKTPVQPTTTLNYTKCPYCNQQVLSTNIQHHIGYCKDAFKPRTKGNCTACEKFRQK